MPALVAGGSDRCYTAVVLSRPERLALEQLAREQKTNLSDVMRNGLYRVAAEHGVVIETPTARVSREA